MLRDLTYTPEPWMNQDEVTIKVPKRLWLSSNMNPPRNQRAAMVRALRELGECESIALRQFDGPVHVVAFVGYPKTAHRADPPNAYPTVKALIDGIVQSNTVIADDDHRHIPLLTFVRDRVALPAGEHHIRLRFTPAPAALVA